MKIQDFADEKSNLKLKMSACGYEKEVNYMNYK